MPPVARRHGPLALALVACLLLIVAEFTTLYRVRIITVVREVSSVGSHHGYALLILALAGAAMAYGATRSGSRPAALALLAIAVAALAIVLAIDLPVVDEEGTFGRDYEQAQAQAATGFFLETAGAVLLLFAAVLILVLGRTDRAEQARTRRERPDAAVSDSA